MSEAPVCERMAERRVGQSYGREDFIMFMRVDKLQADLPAPKKADPNAAAALQELLGGKYGEMSTLNNYMYQS